MIDALDRVQRTGWRICEPILSLVLGSHDPVAEVKRAAGALTRARKTKSKPGIKRAKDDLRKWLTVVQAVALRGKTFYFKCRFDYRGRLYQVGSLLGYTGGDDLARASWSSLRARSCRALASAALAHHEHVRSRRSEASTL